MIYGHTGYYYLRTKTEDAFKDFAPAKRPNYPNNNLAGKWERFEHSRLHRLILILLL